MRIIKVRRGFTTNSSASSEWLPPGATPSHTLPKTPTTSASTPIEPLQVPITQSPAWTDGLRLGSLVALVALLFTTDRLIRKWRAKSQPKDAVDDSE